MSPFRRLSRRFWPLHAYLMISMILWPVPPARSYWTDSNQDGVKEWVDEAGLDPAWWDADSDSDGLTNAQEALYGSDPYAKDSDRDGLSDLVERDYTPPSAPFDPWSWDTDGDGYSDHDEYYVLIQGSPLVVHYSSLSGPFYDYRDADGDGLLNYEDSDPVNMDRDADGLLNWQDPYMDDANNGAGTGYSPPSQDSDFDGIPDESDPFPWGSYWYNGIEYGGSWADADSDGIPDPADAYPNGSFTYNGVEYAGFWSDMDGDLIPDPADPFPYSSTTYWFNSVEYPGSWQDTDGDGIPDPADGWPNDRWNGEPYFTYNGSEYPGAWEDRDGDGVPDAADSWPDDPENGADDDNDGLSNYDERTQHFTDPAQVDTDHDWLTDYEELYVFHTNPKAPRSGLASGQSLLDGQLHLGADADGDELPDILEDYYASLGYGLDKNDPADGAGDLDSDGYTNAQAFTFGWSLIANRGTYDQDGDGMDDAVEDYWAALYPGSMDKTVFEDAVADHDQDGLMNYEEVVRHNINGWLLPADPGDPWSLMRTLGYEVVLGTTPNDGQFMRWWWDVSRADYGGVDNGNPVPADATLLDVSDVEPDPNGLPDGYERWLAAQAPGSNTARAILADEDDDGIPNVWEFEYGLLPRDPLDAAGNPDGDSLTNLQEYQAGRNPMVDDDAPPETLQLHGSPPAEGGVGVAYTASFSASGGRAPYVFTVSSGALPPGLALNTATGQVTGAPTQDGSFDFFVTVTDALGHTAEGSWGITVAGLEISTTTLPVAYLGRVYSTSLTARFGTPPYAFSLVYPSELPLGFSLSTSGAITYDGSLDPLFPLLAGDYDFEVEVWDGAGRTARKTLTLTLEEPPPPPALTFTSQVLAPGTVAWDYNTPIPVAGVQGTATYGLVGAPAWISVDASGRLRGRPTATGNLTFDVWVQDEVWDPSTLALRRAVQTMSLSVAPYLPAHVSIISGDLQIGLASGTFDPIVVMVTDDNGAPMPGIPVTVLGITLLTDATGHATFTLPAFETVGAHEVEVASPAEVATVNLYTYTPPASGQPPLTADVPKPSAPEMRPQITHPEAHLEYRSVSTSSGTIDARWSAAWVYVIPVLNSFQFVPGGPVPDFNKPGLKWATSDGREGPPPDEVPELGSITTWSPGNPAAMYYIAADKTGVLDDVPDPSSNGPATPIPAGVDSRYLYGAWSGTQKDFEEELVADVRLTLNDGSGSGEVKQTFLEIVEEDGQITSAAPITLSTSDPQPHRLEAPKPSTGKRNKKYLRPMELYSDLNNDGTLTSADIALVGKPYGSNGTDAQKDKGTEFVFADDAISNGAWDKQESGAPPSADDDDAEPIIVSIDSIPNQTQVWLEHPASSGLKFYKDKKCTQEIQISSSQPHVVGGSVAWPNDNKVYVRAENVNFADAANPQVEGDLKLMIRSSGASASGIEAGKMKMTFVQKVGATKYLVAAMDYIRENNTSHYYAEPQFNGENLYHVIVLRQQTSAVGFNARPSMSKGIDAVCGVLQYPTFIMNCSYAYGPTTDNGFYGLHGGELYNGSWDTSCSVLGTVAIPPGGAVNAAWVADKGAFTAPSISFGIGDVPAGYTDGTGGLKTYFVPGDSNWGTISDVTIQEEKLIVGAVYPGAGAKIADYREALVKASDSQTILLCDGGASYALAVKDPSGNLKARVKGLRHNGLYLQAFDEALKTYVGFHASPVR